MSRALASLGRFPEAHDAFNHTMALAPANIALHAELGEALVLEAQGTVTPATEDEFAKTPDDLRSRYHAAEAALQHEELLEAFNPTTNPALRYLRFIDCAGAMSRKVGPEARADGAAPTFCESSARRSATVWRHGASEGAFASRASNFFLAAAGSSSPSTCSFRKRRKQLFYRDSEPGAG